MRPSDRSRPAVSIGRVIDAPLERVWKALTDAGDLKQWLPFFSDFKAEVGFETRFMLGRDEAHQYLHICQIQDVFDGQKLSYTWRYDGVPGSSLITYDLVAEGAKTKLKLTYEIVEPYPADNSDFAERNFKQGWTYTAEALKVFAENNK